MVMEAMKRELTRFDEDESVYDSNQFIVDQTAEEQGLTVGKNKNGEIVQISYKKIVLDALGLDKSRKPFTKDQLPKLFSIFSNAYTANSEATFSNKNERVAEEIAGMGKGYGLLNRIWLMAHQQVSA